MAVEDWNTDASQNTTVGGISIAENCPAGNVNNALREIMAQVAAWTEDSGFQAQDDNLDALAGLTLAANRLLYSTGAGALALATLDPFMRGLLAAPNGATFCNGVGAIRVSALSLSNPGYVRLQLGTNQFLQVAWGTASVNGAGVNIIYPINFPTMGFPVISGGSSGANAQVNDPHVNASGIAANGFPVINPRGDGTTISWIAVGY
ncbi:gp53-like domain-containing protein [Sphingobium abikonense]|uniref:gp53-like domain-containing protein n=1 Tax=Sphingobium abikonense TaxID=86193 RepID=UPI003513DE94